MSIAAYAVEIVLAAGALIGVAFGWWQKRRAERESQRADREKRRADTHSEMRGHEADAQQMDDTSLADRLTRGD